MIPEVVASRKRPYRWQKVNAINEAGRTRRIGSKRYPTCPDTCRPTARSARGDRQNLKLNPTMTSSVVVFALVPLLKLGYANLNVP